MFVNEDDIKRIKFSHILHNLVPVCLFVYGNYTFLLTQFRIQDQWFDMSFVNTGSAVLELLYNKLMGKHSTVLFANRIKMDCYFPPIFD